jgi:hypothetical protein
MLKSGSGKNPQNKKLAFNENQRNYFGKKLND